MLPHAFSQFVFDNADFNVNTIDGRDTFHAMGGIQCITPHTGVEPDSSFSRPLKRITAAVKGNFGLISIKLHRKPKASGLSTINVSDVERIRPLAQNIVPTASDFIWLYGKWACCPVIGGWNGFMTEATADYFFYKSRVLCLPFINAPPTDYDTVLTSLLYAIDKRKASNQSTSIVTFDQPLYWKARDITGAADL